jgi:type II secretory pathway predicted ATPase ExeA
MYQAYWGLQKSPFAARTDTSALVASSVHAEALARLDFLCETNSPLGLLLGPSGSGKSVVLAEFAQRAERTGALTAIATAAGAEESHLLPALSCGLKIAPAATAAEQWRNIADRFEELKLESLTAVVLLDDLDRATASARALIERLLGLPDAPLTIVGSARPETLSRLGSALLDQAALRIDLAPWSESETREYLETSLARAGRQQPAFNDASVRRLFELSGGAVRKVNQLAQLALLAGAGQKLVQIDAETIDAVHEELSVAR